MTQNVHTKSNISCAHSGTYFFDRPLQSTHESSTLYQPVPYETGPDPDPDRSGSDKEVGTGWYGPDPSSTKADPITGTR